MTLEDRKKVVLQIYPNAVAAFDKYDAGIASRWNLPFIIIDKNEDVYLDENNNFTESSPWNNFAILKLSHWCHTEKDAWEETYNNVINKILDRLVSE